MTSPLDDLISRVEKAAGPDREIDGEVMRLTDPQNWAKACHRASMPSGAPEATILREAPWYAPQYTASLDAVVALVERELPDWDWGVETAQATNVVLYTGYVAQKMRLGPEAYGPTPTLALLLAFLRAKASGQHPAEGGPNQIED